MTGSNAVPSGHEFPVDLDRLAAWMDQNGIGDGPIGAPRLLTGGTQNILLRFERGPRAFILRRPPLAPRPESDRTMLREARILAALAGSEVPHPALIATCADPAILGAVFYLMAEVPGFNPTVALPEPARSDAGIRHRMGLSLVDGLAALAAIDPDAAGLSDFGRLDGFLERQVGRWASQLEGYEKFQGWPGPGELGPLDAVRAWLDAHRPQRLQPGIIHGDYHIGNVLFDEAGGLTAIVDWEMATLGDPLLDLGRVLSTWPIGDMRMPFTMRVERLDGFPAREELIARYGERTGRDLSDLPWFEVLSCYKLGIILEGTYARAQAGQADPETGERLHASAKGLLQRARDLVEETPPHPREREREGPASAGG